MLNHLSNIWLVDDNEAEHQVFHQALNEIYPGILISHIYNGDHIQELLCRAQPDLLFIGIDISCDGLLCLKSIRENKRFYKMPVIMYTGSHYYPDILFSYGYGATLCILKPSDFRTVKNQLRKLFELDWDNPGEITHIHFQDSDYRTFNTNKKEAPASSGNHFHLSPF
jgi:DNA-binding NtrC family response regulator